MKLKACFRLLSILLAFATFFLICGIVPEAAPDPQGSKPEWTRITDTTEQNSYESIPARTSDGTLHVIWVRKNGNNYDLMHTAVDRDGKVAASPSTVLSSWATLSTPALVAAGSRLYAFWGGLRTTDVKDPYSGGKIYMTTSENSGARWNLDPGGKSTSNSTYASPTAAAISKSGEFVTAWAVSFALGAHVGLDGKQPDLKLESRCCTYQPKFAVDSATGEVALAWYSNVSKENGLNVQTVLPTLGTANYVPGSADDSRAQSLSADQVVGVTGRLDAPGIYVGYCSGYPTCKTVEVWPYRAAQPMMVEQAQGARFVNIAAAPEGRLWVMWMRGGRIYATRSNRAANRFGRAITVQPPPGTTDIWKVGGNGELGPLDLLASMSVPANGLATWHTRVFPPLNLNASPSHFKAAEGGKVVFTVSDVGDPVSGATVTVNGKTLTTDANGHASMTFPKGSKAGSDTATAAMKDYTDAATKVTATAN
ncbi:MAG: hypothetical protein ACM3NO_00915 [Deltaproteobacteria bacterium]